VDEYFMSVHHTSPSKTKKSAHEIDVKCNGVRGQDYTQFKNRVTGTQFHFQQLHRDKRFDR
jgi:hypothetical protein